MDHFKQNGANFSLLQFLNSVHTISASLQCTYSIFQNHFLPSILVNRVRAQDTITFLRAMSPYTDFDFELVLTQSADTLSLILQNICKLTYHFSTMHWTLILSKKWFHMVANICDGLGHLGMILAKDLSVLWDITMMYT